ncbi:hypothetical protein SAMN05216268_1338 [Streptomyces yunnanensis]|uniref:Uncharacterized protein n=1 Tax=Streptomyces yunnanensis TaxID=156453 RepID=A0A9X8R050_9ACTN|nr:hypothetical protein SAMN05216268_1338 [Streptomyces yunnanensis]
MPSMSGPVHLSDPFPEPQPVEGCDICRELVEQRAEHLKRGEYASSAMCALEIGRHRHRRKVTR